MLALNIFGLVEMNIIFGLVELNIFGLVELSIFGLVYFIIFSQEELNNKYISLGLIKFIWFGRIE